MDRRDEKKLNMMKETISWTKPKSVFRGGKKDSRAFGQNSIERSLHSQRISNKIACYYSREYQIPDKPKKNSFAASFTDPDFKVIAISFEEFGEVEESETKSMEEEEIPDYSLNKEIVEFNKKQLRKKASRSILRKMTIESDSESIYTDSEDEDVDQDEDITVLSRSLGALGINIRKQKRFMTSVKKEIVRSEPQQREKITENINWLKIFYDSVTHVQTINANITKMVRNSTTSNLANVLGTISGRANKKKFNSKRKTVPCVWYHGEVGCHRGTNCDFIHDPRYKGRKVPNMKNYVRPIHQLSKRPENNLINMMVYKKAVNTPEGVKPYNNRGGNNFQRNNNRYQNQHQRHQGGRPQAGYGQGYPQQQQHQKMGMNGFMGIVRTSGSKNQFYKPQYPARSHGGGNNGQFQNYNQTQQYNNYSQQQGQYNNQGNYGGYPQGERQQPVGNRQFHQNFNNNVGVNKHQVFNHQSNAVGNSNQR